MGFFLQNINFVNQTKLSKTTMGSLCDAFDHMLRTVQTAVCPKEEESNKSHGFDIPNITTFPT
jgi:hypothetical protein